MIEYASEKYFRSFHSALDRVAREEVHIEMTEAKPFEETAAFQRNLIENDWPGFYAIIDEKVVGWADIFPNSNPRLAHRGNLGMGIVSEHRGKGLGTQLLLSALGHARKIGLEKVELTVYTDNAPAIALYRKCGFTDIGVIKHYRKLHGRYYDVLEMELFL